MITFACAALLSTGLAAQDPTPPKPAAKPQEPTRQEPAKTDKTMGWTGVLDEKAFAALHELTKDKAPKPEGEMVKVGDTMDYLSLPKTGKAPFPAVVVIHEWWGLNDHIKHWTDRLAADGYAALAVDLYAGKNATTAAEAGAAMKAVDETKARATLLAAFDFLHSDPRIAASKRGCIGWCFGGGWSLQLALAAPQLDAAVVYYGRLVDDVDQLKAIHAPLLGVFGNKDSGIPPKSVDAFEAAMHRAGRDCRVLRYDAAHGFANPSGAAYDQPNATAAWTEVRTFLAQKLKGAPATAAPATAPKKDGR
ncbi:MAG TPA: dienelactone hydrolase family protein [Planctomycetota bacterium]|nr:dienelactone hydrolase family protein [Planctomycetota bacterium]